MVANPPPVLVERSTGHVIVHVLGNFDAEKASEFNRAMHDDGAGSVIVDLSDVEVIGSAGLGAILGAIHRDSEQDRFTIIAGARPSVAYALRTAGANRLAAFVPQLADVEREVVSG